MTDPSGATLGAAWGLPFAGLLLSIALLPVLAPGVWRRHSGRIAIGWSAAFVIPFGLAFGIAETAHRLTHTLLLDYVPFMLLLSALFTTAGGIHLRGEWRAGAGANTAVMAAGALLASVLGTTGASMLLIRPLLRANAHRREAAHVVIFFIFIVGNIGGVLTPLGDPPLLLGFLHGVSFFWTTTHLLGPMLFLVVCLLVLFYGLDLQRLRREGPVAPAPAGASGRPGFGIDGLANLLPLAAVLGLVLLSGSWQPDTAFDLFGVRLGLAQGVRDTGMAIVIVLSLAVTPKGVRAANDFSWAPLNEVAELFVGIFVTMIPVLAMLSAGEAGALGAVASLVTGPGGEPRPAVFFWVTGLLSAFLDNAPTYLVFFGLAGGDAQRLMHELPATLSALSAGAVFMGALTYIGNAPNFMVKAIAESRGVRMPGFFGYIAWSGTILLPLFGIVTLVWFR